jgi:type IV pilus assembly protein PilM
MLPIRRPRVYPIGLDVGHECVKMVQLERAGEHLSVLAAATVPLPADARAPQARVGAAAEAVRRALRAGTAGFRGSRAVAAVPREALHVRNLRLAVASDQELAAAVPREAKAALGFEAVDATVQFIPAGQVRQGGEARQEVILLAARKPAINEFLFSLKPSGLALASLDVEPCALYRTVDRFITPDQAGVVHALVDVGAQRTQVVIGRGHDLQFVKSIEIGGWHFEDAVTRKLGLTLDETQALRRRLAGEREHADPHDPVRHAVNDATRGVMEELAGEISLCLRYHAVTFRGQRADHVNLTGGAAADPQLVKIFGRVLALPTAPATAPAGLDARCLGGGAILGEWAVALGLALKCVERPIPAAAAAAAVAGRATEVACA